MFVLGERIIMSASDLTSASECEFAFLRKLDAKLGRNVTVPDDEDAMRDRAAILGNEHEARQLETYRTEFGSDRVVEIASVRAYSEVALEEGVEATRAALASDARVVFQATFFDANYRVVPGGPTIGYVGFADFLVRTGDETSRRWQVQDTKLARRARVPALLQLAAYAEQLERMGVEVDPRAVLLLGDGSASSHTLTDIAPLFRARRNRVVDLIAESATRPGDTVTPWPARTDGERETSQRINACGRCVVCAEQVEQHRDPLLIAGITTSQRGRFLQAGLTTIDEVAAAQPAFTDGSLTVPGVGQTVAERLAWQATLQVAGEGLTRPPVRIIDPRAFVALPEPDPGDLFFDFEGDPMYMESGTDGAPKWGLDYLFGFVDDREEFTALWAHSLAEERAALVAFLDFVKRRRTEFPGMHIYHYAPYERTHLLSIAARHGVGEADVDDLLRDNVLVDLYPVVKRALRIGTRSYSIKKLEPLYMGEELRDDDGVTSGDQSVVEYSLATEHLRSGDPDTRAEGQSRLEAIADYNRYDCVSTRRLRNWLLTLAREHPSAPVSTPGPGTGADEEPELGQPIEISPLGERLTTLAQEARDETEAQAVRLAASAIDYYQREHKSFWWEHYARLTDPIDDWADTRDVMVVDQTHSEIETEWHLSSSRAKYPRRMMRLRGDIAPGTTYSAGSELFAVYDDPIPFMSPRTPPGQRAVTTVWVEEVHDDGVTVLERLPKDSEKYDELPVALTPGPPPRVDSQQQAILEWGTAYADALETGAPWQDPVKDILLRAPVLSEIEETENGREPVDMIDRVSRALVPLQGHALAVQGPPGTGKTYLAAHVMKRLVTEHGWKIGVVAQSHKVVENVLDGAVRAGIDPSLVGKAAQRNHTRETRERVLFTVFESRHYEAFLRDHPDGCIVGGTAWDFSNPGRFSRRELDLLVIDEAGQFSLAPTIASAIAAKRLLLLGDPQQLPQVTQGTHPEPIDTSALGWLIGDHDTLPAELGFFLAETRRMRPELAQSVSHLSYEGRLSAHADASAREVSGAGPAGLTWHPVEHRHNATHSEEEAAEVVRIVRDCLSGTLHEAGKPPRRLTQNDLIVVAPYNAQVECVTAALETAGYPGVRVGTVDRFQGQEAVIAIVTLAASSPDEIPRGIEFLLMRNRLNVAISRAQWAAHIVSSPALSGTGLPSSLAGAKALSGYLFLTEAGTR